MQTTLWQISSFRPTTIKRKEALAIPMADKQKLSKKALLASWARNLIRACPVFGIIGVFSVLMLLGYRTYKKILTKPGLPADPEFYFIDYAGSGDTYLCCSYLADKGKINDQAVFVAAGELSRKIAVLFGFTHIITLTRYQAFFVRIMGRFYGEPLRLHPLLYESEPLRYSGILRHMQGVHGIDFAAMLRVGFSNTFQIDYENTKFDAVPLHCDTAYLDTVFRDLGLSEGKTVLLAPYAGRHTMLDIPMALYEQLAAALQQQGFMVCTNSCNGKEEPVIPGTIPVFLPHEAMGAFCQRAGYFVGTRSGLCDILSAFHMKGKIILYPPELPGEGIGTWIEFFSLKNMGLCDDALELEYAGLDATAAQILHYIKERETGETCSD